MEPGSDLQLGDGPRSVLLLHGFTGTPFEVAPLARALADAGHRCLAPLLPGHGGSFDALAATDLRAWRRGVTRALAALPDTPVDLVGFSLGSLLATLAAADRPDRVRRLALLAPAFDFQGGSRVYRDLFRLPLVARLVPKVKKSGSNVTDPARLAGKPTFPFVPTRLAAELAAAQDEARRALPSIRCRTLVMWGAHDRVVPRRAAEYAARHVGSGPARFRVFAHSAHHLALDVEAAAVADELVRFFAEPRSAGDHAGPRPAVEEIH